MRSPSEERPTLLALLTVLALPALVFAGGISDCPEKKVCSYSREPYTLTCDVLNENNCTHWYAAMRPLAHRSTRSAPPHALRVLIETAVAPTPTAARSPPRHTSQGRDLLRH